jgi:2-dehydro-3-deoxygalactonokinase
MIIREKIARDIRQVRFRLSFWLARADRRSCGSCIKAMSEAAFIGVDWGTSNARFLLVSHNGSMIEQRDGPGIGQIDGAAAIEDVCFGVIADWIAYHPKLPVIMIGTVGSNIGWHMAPYADTPATFDTIVSQMLTFEAQGTHFTIAPGLATIRSDGLPDVMRGEEVQIFSSVSSGDALVCLPGTHSKWACVSDGVVTTFHTAPTGELLDIIGRHSILLNPKRPVAAAPDTAFLEGIENARNSKLGLESLLFTVRSRQITHSLKAGSADSYLAGLFIGAEIKSALTLYGTQHSTVMIVGSPELAELYSAGLASFGITATKTDGNTASLSGLVRLYHARQQ